MDIFLLLAKKWVKMGENGYFTYARH